MANSNDARKSGHPPLKPEPQFRSQRADKQRDSERKQAEEAAGVPVAPPDEKIDREYIECESPGQIGEESAVAEAWRRKVA